MKVIHLLLILLFCLFISGCSLINNNSVDTIQIITDQSANNEKITRIDVVFIYGGTETMPKTAAEWFAGEKERVLNVPDNFKVVKMRVPPGLVQEVEMPPKYGKATDIYAYVNFEDSGDQPPLDLTEYKNPVIMVEKDHYKLSWRR